MPAMEQSRGLQDRYTDCPDRRKGRTCNQPMHHARGSAALTSDCGVGSLSLRVIQGTVIIESVEMVHEFTKQVPIQRSTPSR